MRNNQYGFTLIELLMVVMLVAIMALIAIPQFVDYQTNAKDQATKGALGALRTGVETAKGTIVVKCNGTPGTLPTGLNVANNDLTNGAGAHCTTGQLTLDADRRFITPSSWPIKNPWNNNAAGDSTVNICPTANTANCTARTHCAAVAITSTTTGWCYIEDTGVIFANSDAHGENDF